ncbi:phosphotransferase enzyme family protein [Brevibacillus sp. NRS-1366]|uniref:phosphotransferase enzyme family protein n=1 Tax=Brevibacillus sp. NRS-1366 TaxID=3233899 RepID=UPI003D211F8D
MLPAIEQSILSEIRNRYGIFQENISPLGGFDSYVYEFTKNGTPFILKISHSQRRTESELQGEIDWLQYVANHGVSVARAIPSELGNQVEVIGHADSYFTAVAFEKAPGHLPTKENWDPQLFEKWGRITGKLHSLSKSYQPHQAVWKRKKWDDEEHLNIQRYIPAEQEIVIKKSNELLSRLKSIPETNENYGIIHGDLHFLNFHIHDGDLILFDFDDSAYNYFLYDVAVILFYAYWRPLQETDDRRFFIKDFLTWFLKGYRQENEFPSEWFAYLPDFLKLRHLVQYVVFLQSVEGKPLTGEDEETLEHLNRVIEKDWPIIDVDFIGMVKEEK